MRAGVKVPWLVNPHGGEKEGRERDCFFTFCVNSLGAVAQDSFFSCVYVFVFACVHSVWSLNPELYNLASLAGQQSSGVFLSLPYQL